MQKQNKRKRGIGALLALTSVTACLVAGTFAKYVTSGVATASARVAKFGVEVEIDGNTSFATSYDPTGDGAQEAGIYTKVTSSNTDKVVAPGTGEKDAITFKIKGTPESAVSLYAKILGVGEKQNPEEVFLASGQYKDYTNMSNTNNFQIGADGYYPVVFALTDKSTDPNNETPAVTGNIAKINEYLAANVTSDLDPNVEIKKTYSLSWRWATESPGDNATTVDSADTLLGNLSANKEKYIKSKYTPGMTDTDGTFSDLTEGTDYSTNISMTLSLGVAQDFGGSNI